MGAGVGVRVGTGVGAGLGTVVGAGVGAVVGTAEGAGVGDAVGTVDGAGVGARVGVAVGALHVPLAHVPLMQSVLAAHAKPAAQAGHTPPPQSTSVSTPPFTPSKQLLSLIHI